MKIKITVLALTVLAACGNIEPPQPDAGEPELACDTWENR